MCFGVVMYVVAMWVCYLCCLHFVYQVVVACVGVVVCAAMCCHVWCHVCILLDCVGFVFGVAMCWEYLRCVTMCCSMCC